MPVFAHLAIVLVARALRTTLSRRLVSGCRASDRRRVDMRAAIMVTRAANAQCGAPGTPWRSRFRARTGTSIVTGSGRRRRATARSMGERRSTTRGLRGSCRVHALNEGALLVSLRLFGYGCRTIQGLEELLSCRCAYATGRCRPLWIALLAIPIRVHGCVMPHGRHIIGRWSTSPPPEQMPESVIDRLRFRTSGRRWRARDPSWTRCTPASSSPGIFDSRWSARRY